ncbi:DinB family protein [Alicyclobacillus sp. SO9]|uniref:DinB family protein n=1 Tax=Alicyclobacillus sp. SO9 TaxID=2665646 RepID=UPI0018E8EB26|nr:DinB family protein [Alicyclobacillus sp. SO9]QQE77099.1 DinB family protein [Alicyclobacillus sp. SO9]
MSSISSTEFYQYYSGLTQGLLEHLVDEQLQYRPYESLKTLGEELRHIADAREIYLRAMVDGTGPSWKEKRMDPEMAVSVEKLRAFYDELDRRFRDFFHSEIEWSKAVPWKGMGENLDIEACLDLLTHFECTHQGIVSVYLSGLGIKYDIAG